MRSTTFGLLLTLSSAALIHCGSDDTSFPSMGPAQGGSPDAGTGGATAAGGHAGKDVGGHAGNDTATGGHAGEGGDGGFSEEGGSGGNPGTGGSQPQCDPGLADCNGICVDLETNTEHCGTCIKHCEQTETCAQGNCKALPATCPCPVESYCDLSSNTCVAGCLGNDNCSVGRYCDTSDRKCKPGCRTTDDCANNEECIPDTHQCECVAATHDCGGSCVENGAAEHCGSLCSPCPGTEHGTSTCNGTACGISCDAQYHECSGACLPNQSTESCGSLCTPCPTDALGDPECIGGQCGIKCHDGAHKEGSACVADETCDGQTCSGNGQCVAEGGQTRCECNTGYEPENMTCVPTPCQEDSGCPLEFFCNDQDECEPGCNNDMTRCPEGLACRSDNWDYVCSATCYGDDYYSYECNGDGWYCLGGSKCRYECYYDDDCGPDEKCANFAINYSGYWEDEYACVKKCQSDPGECGEGYDNDQGPCTCAEDGLCRDPMEDECRLPAYVGF